LWRQINIGLSATLDRASGKFSSMVDRISLGANFGLADEQMEKTPRGSITT